MTINSPLTEKPKETFDKVFRRVTKQLKMDNPHLVYAIVDITARQSSVFKDYLDTLSRLGANMNKNNSLSIDYLYKVIEGEDCSKGVFFVSAPVYEKYISLYLSAPFLFNSYKNKSSFCRSSIQNAYCVTNDGVVLRDGVYALAEVRSLSKKTANQISFLSKDIPNKLGVIVKLSEEDDKITYYAIPHLVYTHSATSLRKEIGEYCVDKRNRLALALNNCKDAYLVDVVGGKPEPVIHCGIYANRSDDYLLDIAQTVTKKRNVSFNSSVLALLQ